MRHIGRFGEDRQPFAVMMLADIDAGIARAVGV